MDSRRVGLIVVVALIALALVGAGVQGAMHQQWMQGFAVGQMAAGQGAATAGAAVAPYVYGAGFRHFNPFMIFFQIFIFILLAKIACRIVRRMAWRHGMAQNPELWGRPGNPQPWAQGQMPPWTHHGPWMHHGGWSQPAAQTQSPTQGQPQGQPQPAAPSAPSYGPQPPIDL